MGMIVRVAGVGAAGIGPPMALKVAELSIALSANLSGLASGMQRATQIVSDASKRMAALSEKMAGLGRTALAPLAAMAANASQYDEQVRRSTQAVQGQFAALSVEVGRTLGPAMRDLANVLGGVTRTLRELDPATKRQISGFAEMALKATIVATAGAKIFGVAGQLAEALAPMAGLLSRAFAAPELLPLLLLLTAIVGVVGALKLAWEAWGDAIKKAMSNLAPIKGLAATLAAIKPFMEASVAVPGQPQQQDYSKVSPHYQQRGPLVNGDPTVEAMARIALEGPTDADLQNEELAEWVKQYKLNDPAMRRARGKSIVDSLRFAHGTQPAEPTGTLAEGLSEAADAGAKSWTTGLDVIKKSFGELTETLTKSFAEVAESLGKTIAKLQANIAKGAVAEPNRLPDVDVQEVHDDNVGGAKQYEILQHGGVMDATRHVTALSNAAKEVFAEFRTAEYDMEEFARSIQAVFGQKLQALLQTMMGWLGPVGQRVQAIAQAAQQGAELGVAMRALFSQSKGLGDVIGKLKPVWDKMAAALKPVTDAFAAAFKKIAGVGSSIMQKLAPVWDWITKAIKPVTDVLGKAIGSVRNAIENTVKTATNALGGVGKNIAQGLSGLLDPSGIGAVVMVVAQLMAQSKQAQALMTGLDNVFQAFADEVGVVVTILSPLVQGLSSVAKWFEKALGIGSVVFSKLQPVWNRLMQAMKPVTEVLDKLGESTLRGLFMALKMLATGLLELMLAVRLAMNSVSDTAREIINVTTAAMPELRKRLLALLPAHMGTDDLEQALKDLASLTYESAAAQADLAKAASDAAESLTNVPAAYNVALARYNAARGVASAQELAVLGGGSAGAGGAGGGASPGNPNLGRRPPPGQGGGTTNVTVNVPTVHVELDSAELVKAVRLDQDDLLARRHGPGGGSFLPRFA